MEKSCGYGRLLHGEAVAMGLAWEAILGMKLGVTGGELVDDLVSLLIDMGFPLDDPGVALTSIAASIGMDKKRMVSDVDLPLVAAPGRCELRRVPLAEIRRELPGIRAEIRERSIARDLNIPAGDAIQEESPVSNLVRVGDEVYEIRSVEEKTAPAAPEEAEPEIAEEQDAAAGSEPSPAPPEIPDAPAVRTVTLADLYWSQGEHSTARRIVGEILRDDPENLRAQAWLAVRAGDDLEEADLLGFLETMAKEYGYDLS
jgi:biotin carboxyl carrier protein